MNEQISPNDGESFVLVFTVTAAIPSFEINNLSRWYYTTSAPWNTELSSTYFLEITNLDRRTSQSVLTLSPGRFSLTIILLVLYRTCTDYERTSRQGCFGSSWTRNKFFCEAIASSSHNISLSILMLVASFLLISYIQIVPILPKTLYKLTSSEVTMDN